MQKVTLQCDIFYSVQNNEKPALVVKTSESKTSLKAQQADAAGELNVFIVTSKLNATHERS